MEDEELEVKDEGCGCVSVPGDEAGAEQEYPEDTESPPQAGQ